MKEEADECDVTDDASVSNCTHLSCTHTDALNMNVWLNQPDSFLSGFHRPASSSTKSLATNKTYSHCHNFHTPSRNLSTLRLTLKGKRRNKHCSVEHVPTAQVFDSWESECSRLQLRVSLDYTPRYCSMRLIGQNTAELVINTCSI